MAGVATDRPLTPVQLAALQVVAETRDGRRPPAIAALAGLRTSGVYVILGRLVGRGLLERRGSRPPRYVVTREGRKAIAASVSFYQRMGGET